MSALSVLSLLGLLAVVLIVVAVIQRTSKKGDPTGDGADVIAYLVLALAMGVSGFALAELVSTAFPGDRFVFDPAQNVATALASLVVAAPFAFFFWRRQARRRATYPASAGWTLYLALMEAVFMTAFVVTAVMFITGLIDESRASAWTGAVVFGAFVGFHEWAALRTPPRSDSAELSRVIGSAIGLVTLVVGTVGVLSQLFADMFSLALNVGFHPFTAMLLVGAPVWAYRWFRPWDAEPGAPRVAWTVGATVASLTVAIGATTYLLFTVLQYLLTDTPPATSHFDGIPVPLSLAIVAVPVFVVHRRALGRERTNPVRLYEYVMAGIGLAAAVVAAIGLTVVAFDRSIIVGGAAEDIVAVTTILVVGLVLWRLYTARSQRGAVEDETVAWPRRIYHLGLGIVFALVAAGALISTLLIVLRRALGSDGGESLLTPLAILLYTGLAAWYLLAGFARDRAVTAREDVIVPFEVTVIASHPGMLATKFPKQARLHMIHRGDDAGMVDEEMADAIVAAVGHESSIVWVDGDGFRVAPKLPGS